jgi:hypothetical protein
MTAVFCKEVPYGGSPISFKEVHGCFKFNTDTAFRCATLIFQAENESEKDLYRVIIEGTGNDLRMYRFTFEPSLSWLCRRYPEKSRVTASSGGALDSDSQGKTQKVAEVGLQSAASEPVVRNLKLRNSFQIQVTYAAVVQNPTRTRSYKKVSKCMQKLRASARLARNSAAEVCTGPPRPPSN